MKKSELLRQATLHLKCNENRWLKNTQKSMFICVAVHICARQMNVKTGSASALRTASEICKIIEKRMGGVGNLASWLEKQGLRPKPRTNHDLLQQVKAIQAYRMAWMRELIREFEEKGE